MYCNELKPRHLFKKIGVTWCGAYSRIGIFRGSPTKTCCGVYSKAALIHDSRVFNYITFNVSTDAASSSIKMSREVMISILNIDRNSSWSTLSSEQVLISPVRMSLVRFRTASRILRIISMDCCTVSSNKFLCLNRVSCKIFSILSLQNH